jgi:hypothetical protein
MSRFKPALIALTLFVTATAARAQAPVQPPTQPYSPPVISPYLNLLNRGNPAAINYYGIIRPQVQQSQQLQLLQFGLTKTAEEATAALTQPTTAPGALPDTGHAVGFMTYPRYFNTVNPHGR